MTDKTISAKRIGSNQEADVLHIQPGTTVRDVLQSLGLGAGYAITNPSSPDQSFNPDDNIYAMVEDGDMLAIASSMVAGSRGVAA